MVLLLVMKQSGGNYTMHVIKQETVDNFKLWYLSLMTLTVIWVVIIVIIIISSSIIIRKSPYNKDFHFFTSLVEAASVSGTVLKCCLRKIVALCFARSVLLRKRTLTTLCYIHFSIALTLWMGLKMGTP